MLNITLFERLGCLKKKKKLCSLTCSKEPLFRNESDFPSSGSQMVNQSATMTDS